MRVDLADLSLRVGERYRCESPLEMEPLLLGGSEYSVAIPEGVEIFAERITGGYLVEVAFAAKAFGPCVRCLKESVVDLKVSEEEFAPAGGDDWDEVSEFISGLEVDVTGLAREALLLAMPEPVLCCKECKGICPTCGSDLNEGPCRCSGLE